MKVIERRYATAIVLLGLAWAAPPAGAGDLSGGARVYTVTTDGGDRAQRALSQDYNLRLYQPLTAWLVLFLAYQDNDYRGDDGGEGDFGRRSQEPMLELAYNRDIVSARLGVRDRRTRGTSDADTLDLRSVYGQFYVRPGRGPYYSLRLDDSRNVADVAVFGRDVDTTNVTFDTGYTTRKWSARYSLQDFSLDNNLSGYALDQQRHTAHATYADRFLDDRVRLSTDWLVTRTDQDERAPDGQTLAEPLAAREGLSAVDTTPELGPLDPTPTLVDGDTLTPAAPLIEVGGANTFRNLGVDLGFTQQVTRLEVTVDALSDTTLVWQVYHGPDNLNWEPIGGVLSTFDATFLRYTLRFPETTDRYFKAVNISVNARPNVAVTEVRALLDVARLGHRSRRAITQRGYVLAGIDPNNRFGASLSVSYNDDSGSGANLPVQDTRQVDLGSLLSYRLGDTLTARAQVQRSRFRRDLRPSLTRDERRYMTSLAWTPLPTAEALLSASLREETERGDLLRRSSAFRARASTALLPGLRLVSEVARDDIEDPFSGFDLASWTWKETFDTRPTEFLTMRGGWSIQRFDATGRVSLERRNSLYGRADWLVTQYLSLAVDWTYGSEDGRRTLTQSYGVNWAPGPRLSLSASYASTDSLGEVETSSAGGSMDYRLNQYLGLFATLSRSTLSQALSEGARVTSLQFGLTLAF